MIDPYSREVVETTGTIWEEFPCEMDEVSSTLRCQIDPTPRQPAPIPNTGDKFCFGTTFYDVRAAVLPRYWEPVLDRSLPLPARPVDLGNYVSTPLYGVITWAKLADSDLSMVHEWCTSKVAWEPTDLFTLPFASPDAIACKSDWLFKVRPYGAHAGTRQFGSLYGGTEENSKSMVKVEYEHFYGSMVSWMGGFPRRRDLIFTAGRWVIDCAHTTFKSELHPIFMFAKMKTVTTLRDPFTGLVDPNPFGGTVQNPIPATQADIWVNGWYPGDPIEFDLYPPPRPHPDATLVVNKPVDAQAVHGLNFEYKMDPLGGATKVHVRVTAPLRRNHVTWLGEMKWETGRSYEGQWYIHWSR